MYATQKQGTHGTHHSHEKHFLPINKVEQSNDYAHTFNLVKRKSSNFEKEYNKGSLFVAIEFSSSKDVLN